MERYYDLNKLRLEADEQGFILGGVLVEPRLAVVGDFETPETIIVRFARKDVLLSYTSQPEVLNYEFKGDADSDNPEAVVIEAVFTLAPNINWFEIDHTKFNEVYTN